MKTIGGVRFFRGVLFVKDANSIATKDKIYQGKKKTGSKLPGQDGKKHSTSAKQNERSDGVWSLFA